MLRKHRNKDDIKARCSFIQVILLMAMILFLALPQGKGISVSTERTSTIYGAENQYSPGYLTYKSDF